MDGISGSNVYSTDFLGSIHDFTFNSMTAHGKSVRFNKYYKRYLLQNDYCCTGGADKKCAKRKL